jgi:hypothetical protein
MPTPAPELKKIRELVALAQSGPGASLPDETHQCYPIPLPATASSMKVAFLYSPSHLQRGVGLVLSAPNHEALLDLASGRTVEMKKVTPAELGVNDEPGKNLGRSGLPEGMTPEQYLAEQGRLYDSYDVLLPIWASGLKLEEATDQPRAVAHEFRRLFARVSEPPLVPYYRAVGRDFFGWIDRAARAG